MAQFYYIVSRDWPDLYDHLRREFFDEPEMEVITDRRVAERRRQEAGAPVERRRRGRRRLDHDVAEQLRERGWAIVRSEQ